MIKYIIDINEKLSSNSKSNIIPNHRLSISLICLKIDANVMSKTMNTQTDNLHWPIWGIVVYFKILPQKKDWWLTWPE